MSKIHVYIILILAILMLPIGAFCEGRNEIVPRIEMADGHAMPQFGLGAFNLGQPFVAERILETAADHGYRHFDLGHSWTNVQPLAQALTQSDVARDECWVSMAISHEDFKEKGVNFVVDSIIKASGIEYIDILYLIDLKDGHLKDHWQEMAKVNDNDKVRNIGLSDFKGDEHAIDAVCDTGIMPTAVQIIMPPYAQMPEWVDKIKDKGISTVCVIPLLGDELDMELFTNDLVGVVANHHNKTPQQVVLKWHLQQGMSVVAGSCRIEDLSQLIGLFDFQLSEAEYETMSLAASTIKPSPFLLQQIQKLIDGYLLFTY